MIKYNVKERLKKKYNKSQRKHTVKENRKFDKSWPYIFLRVNLVHQIKYKAKFWKESGWDYGEIK